MAKIKELAKVEIQSTPGTITDNLPTVKAILKEQFEPFMGKEVTSENLADAKKSRAEANKIFNDIDSKRKSIKRDWNKPYKSWEESLSDAISYLTDYMKELDIKIKDVEQKLLDQKMQDIETIINERLELETESTAQFIRDIDWFRNPKWINKGETLKKIENEINAIIDNINRDLNILSREEEFYSPMLDEYKKHGQLGEALDLKERLIVEKNRMAQLKAEAEARREQQRLELEKEAETKRRLEQEELAKAQSIQNQPVVEENTPTDLFGAVEEQPVIEEPVQEEEPQSIPLTNNNWQETEYKNRIEEQQEVKQPLVEPPKEPELLYGGPRDYIKISIGYEFKTDVATARYLKDMAKFLGAEANIIVPAKPIKG